MTRAQGFALLTPAQRAEVSRKGGRAAHASGHANQFTSKTARAAGLKSAARESITNISPHATGADRYCYECATKHNEREMRAFSPVPGLTVWLCGRCTP